MNTPSVSEETKKEPEDMADARQHTREQQSVTDRLRKRMIWSVTTYPLASVHEDDARYCWPERWRAIEALLADLMGEQSALVASGASKKERFKEAVERFCSGMEKLTPGGIQLRVCDRQFMEHAFRSASGQSPAHEGRVSNQETGDASCPFDGSEPQIEGSANGLLARCSQNRCPLSYKFVRLEDWNKRESLISSGDNSSVIGVEAAGQSLHPEASTEREWRIEETPRAIHVFCGITRLLTVDNSDKCEVREIKELVSAHNSACSLLRQENKTLSEENDGMAAIIQRLEGKSEAATPSTQGKPHEETGTATMKTLLLHAVTLLRASRYAIKKPHLDHAGYLDSTAKRISVIEHHYGAFSEPLTHAGAIHSTAPKETKSAGLAGAVTAKLERLAFGAAIEADHYHHIKNKRSRQTSVANIICDALEESAAIALAEQAEKEKSLDSQPSSTGANRAQAPLPENASGDGDKCEGCGAPATTSDPEGVPLCEECAKLP